MKKIFLFLILCLSISACSVRLDHFINPLFYEDLQPISKSMNGWIYHLTPTAAKCTHPEFSGDGCEDGVCQLIDQSETQVLFECLADYWDKVQYPNGRIHRLLFKINCLNFRCSCGVTMYEHYGDTMTLDYIPDDAYGSKFYIDKPNCISDRRGYRINNPTTQK